MEKVSSSLLTLLIMTPMVTGAISSFASVTIMIMIHRSTVKLRTTYRRLFFALSTFDLAQALSQSISTLPMPIGSRQWAVGNDFSCNLQGFFNAIGSLGAIWYSLSISMYFFLVIKYNISDDTLKKTYEPYLHAIPISCSLGTAIFLLATNNINPAGESCWIAPDPIECLDNPDVICKSRGNPMIVRLLYCVQFFIVFFTNCLILLTLWYVVYIRYKKQQKMRFSWIQTKPVKQHQLSSFLQRSSTTMEPPPGDKLLSNVDSEDSDQHGEDLGAEENLDGWCEKFRTARSETHEELKKRTPFSFRSLLKRIFFSCSFRFNIKPLFGTSTRENSTQDPSPLAQYMSRPCKSFLDKQREITNRALAFIVGFLLTYVFAVIYRSVEILHPGGEEPPFCLKFLARFFFPMQGFFNILCFTYPHVLAKCRNDAEMTKFQAFWEVVKSGGDKDQMFNKRRTSVTHQLITFPAVAEEV